MDFKIWKTHKKCACSGYVALIMVISAAELSMRIVVGYPFLQKENYDAITLFHMWEM